MLYSSSFQFVLVSLNYLFTCSTSQARDLWSPYRVVWVLNTDGLEVCFNRGLTWKEMYEQCLSRTNEIPPRERGRINPG
ncbi:hypothetical protein BCV70DRAFT_122303 [Testicularia cyperi]|uniref:Secreted protein n=1 Tax=Testicularia cyperi TaxID=1882483 RepID=A0A317XL08_9BASI|nr:hypothetical protein BCV70DRAFT_122303 [Testicularia cyperi]